MLMNPCRQLLLKTAVMAFLVMSCFHFLLPQASASGPLNVSISSNPIGLIPLTTSDATSSSIQSQLFESLLDRDLDTFEWGPSLAKSWTISEDGKTFTFVLDEKAKFWDGSPVTVEDVKFSYELIFRKGVDSAPLRPYYQAIDKVERVDDQTIRFTTRDVYYKNFDVAAGLTILQKKFYEELYKKDQTLATSQVNRQAMGTGMWQVESWEENRRLILKRNENYWAKEREVAKGRWNYERIVYSVIQESSVRLENLKKGNLSYLVPTNKQFAKEMDGEPFGTKITKVQAVNRTPNSYRFIGWNNRHEILGNKDVRWALSHLANIRLWAKKFEYDLSEPTIGPMSPKTDQHDPLLKAVSFNRKEARKRLAAAGWSKAGPDGFLVKEGKRFEITILFPSQAKDVYEPMLTEYKNQAKRVGIDIQLRGLEWTSFVKKLDERDFDAVVLGWTRAHDPDLKQIWHSDSIKEQGSNFVAYENPELDKLIDEHRKTMSYDERVKLARKMQNLIYNDQPYTFLLESKYVLYAHQSNIKKPKDVFNYGIGIPYWTVP